MPPHRSQPLGLLRVPEGDDAVGGAHGQHVAVAALAVAGAAHELDRADVVLGGVQLN